MENSLKGLTLAAGIIITCIIISLGFYVAREARDTAAVGTSQIHELQAEFTETAKTLYDGTEVSGSEVINAIRKFEKDIMGVFVKTKKDSTYYHYTFDIESGELKTESSADYNQAQEVTSKKYINPTARFMGTIVKDANGTITGIIFEQK